MRRGFLKWVVITSGGAMLLLLVLLMLDFLLSEVSPTGPGADGEWEPVAAWSGQATKSTDTFHISSGQWRISWTTSGAESFEIFVYNSAGGLRGQAANVIGTDSDSAVIRGDGDYYLVINTAQPYQIAVEEIN